MFNRDWKYLIRSDREGIIVFREPYENVRLQSLQADLLKARFGIPSPLEIDYDKQGGINRGLLFPLKGVFKPF